MAPRKPHALKAKQVHFQRKLDKNANAVMTLGQLSVRGTQLVQAAHRMLQSDAKLNRHLVVYTGFLKLVLYQTTPAAAVLVASTFGKYEVGHMALATRVSTLQFVKARMGTWAGPVLDALAAAHGFDRFIFFPAADATARLGDWD